jgi:hypothetical protein
VERSPHPASHFAALKCEPTLPLQGGIITLTQQNDSPKSTGASADLGAGAPDEEFICLSLDDLREAITEGIGSFFSHPRVIGIALAELEIQRITGDIVLRAKQHRRSLNSR